MEIARRTDVRKGDKAIRSCGSQVKIIVLSGD
jgi:hypothetical protein